MFTQIIQVLDITTPKSGCHVHDQSSRTYIL